MDPPLLMLLLFGSALSGERGKVLRALYFSNYQRLCFLVSRGAKLDFEKKAAAAAHESSNAPECEHNSQKRGRYIYARNNVGKFIERSVPPPWGISLPPNEFLISGSRRGSFSSS